MRPVDWLLRVWSPGGGDLSSRRPAVDPRTALYPEFFVTALEPRRVLNAAPIISAQDFTVTNNAQDGDVVGTVQASDPDPGDVITFSITNGNMGNVFAIHSQTGAITVANAAPLGNQSPYSLTVQVTDTEGLSSSATITITVIPPPVSPIINDQFFIVAAGSPDETVVGQVEVVDPGGGDLTFSITAGNEDQAFAIDPVTGILSVADQELLATPGSRTLTVQVEDGVGETDTATIEVRLNGAPTDVTLNPSVVPENASGAVIGTITVTDPNPDDTFTFQLSDERFEVVGGELKLKDDAFLNFEVASEVSLTITVFDEANASLSELFVIEVLDRNDPPTDITLDAQPVPENSPGAVIGLVSVEDEDDPATSFGMHDFLVMEQDGTESTRFFVDSDFQLALVAGEFLNFEDGAEVVLRIRATDNPDQVGGEPRLEIERTFTITVVGVNDPPVAFDKNFTTPENTPLTGNVLVGGAGDEADFDEDNDTLTVVTVNGVPLTENEAIVLDSGATLVVDANGDFTYDASTSAFFRSLLAGVEVPDFFIYTITDGNEAFATATVNVTVVGVNNPPTVVEQVNATGTEGDVFVYTFEQLLVLFEVEDPDTPVEDLRIEIFGLTNGSISLENGVGGPNTTFVITPDESFNGDFLFQYKVIDLINPDVPLESNVGTATISLAAVNTPPTFEFSDAVRELAEEMTEDTSLPLPGVVWNSFDDAETDAEDATYRVLETSFGVSVEFTPDGGLTIIPLANYNGPAWVVIEAEDEGDVDDPPLTASATLTIWIKPVNDAPVAVTEEFTTQEFTLAEAAKAPLTGNVLQNDFDIDADPILNQGLLAMDEVNVDNLEALFGLNRTSVELLTPATPNGDGSVTLADGGILFLYSDGEFSYTPAQSYFGVETFEYRVKDMQGTAATGTVRLEVTPINDPPSFDPIESPIELDPLNPSVVLITNAVPGPPNEIAPNVFFPDAAGQELEFTVISSNPAFLPASSIQINRIGETTWEIVFPVLPFRNEVVSLTIRADDQTEGPGVRITEQVVEVVVIVGQVPASSREFERREPASFPAAERLEIIPTIPITPVVTVTPVQEAAASTQSASQSERQVVVYLVSHDRTGQLQEDPKLTLGPEMLNDLNEIFRRLPDDRFRIYLHLEDNSRRLVVDVYVRDGKPFNPDDLDAEIIFPEVMNGMEEPSEGASDQALPGTEEASQPGPELLQELSPRGELPLREASLRSLPSGESRSTTLSSLSEPPTDDSALPFPETSIRWGLVAGSVAMLGTRKQRRTEAARALAACADRPLHRFLPPGNNDIR